MIDPAQNATTKEKYDAFEWLRELSLSDFDGSHHAAVMLYEVHSLREKVTQLESVAKTNKQ